MGRKKSTFSAARKQRQINQKNYAGLSADARLARKLGISKRLQSRVNAMSPNRRATYLNNWKITNDSRIKAPIMVFKLLRSPRVKLHRLTKKEIDEMLKKYVCGNRDSRRFANHSLARQNVSATFPARFCIGAMDVECEFCGSLSFHNELKYSCCQKGKVVLPPLSEFPPQLQDLFENQVSAEAKNFRKYIRKYNNLFAFASTHMTMAKDIPVKSFGAGVLRISGHVFHKTGHLHPSAGNAPFYNHFYIYDGQEALEQRCASLMYDINLSKETSRIIQQTMDRLNPFAASYYHLFQVEQEERALASAEGREAKEYFMTFIDKHLGSRKSNKPLHQEVAAIFSNADGEPPQRQFVVKSRGDKFIFLRDTDPLVDPLSYPLLFPSGDLGFSLNVPHQGRNATAVRNRVTLREYYNYRLSVRNESFNPIFSSGMLFQQFLVDAYVKIESDRLNYLKTHQSVLRVEKYTGLIEFLENKKQNGQNIATGTPVILPSTYEGSPRSQQMRYQDAMAVVGKYGKPDLFITMTCNPKWPEIVDNLKPGQTYLNAPHLTARVFQVYMGELLRELWTDGILGKVCNKISVVEFQKRGLPHCHLLIHFKSEDKLRSPEDIDSLISAEIPDKNLQPLLYETVKSCMMHGPCGDIRPSCPCMKPGKNGVITCSKNFPKQFLSTTHLSTEANYPEYRRRDMPNRFVTKTGPFGCVNLDNRWVVPYNPYLTQKYNCHVNVESCQSVHCVKYLYKYIYKGHDEESLRFDQGTDDCNEIEDFVDGRYVSAPEAAWRIFSFPMHDNSHVVTRLSCHLPDSQNVFFKEGEEELAASRSHETTLTAWLAHNAKNPTCRILYCDMVEDFIYDGGKWKPRKRRSKKPTIGRMYNVSPRDVERYHLRLLLLHARGAKSFTDLRTVDDTCHPTFKEACLALGLTTDDREFFRTMRDTVLYATPGQCRRVFCYLLLFCDVTDSSRLWTHFKPALCEDHLRRGLSIRDSENMALYQIDCLLRRNGSTTSDFDLPVPNYVVDVVDEVNVPVLEVSKVYSSLNAQQKGAADSICSNLSGAKSANLFFIDGPAGTGKTYLYNYLLKYCAANDLSYLCSAWVGIAATLLQNGRTCHATFKLPVPCLDGAKCNISPSSEYAQQLRSTKLFLIDEVSMVNVYALHAIDRMLRDICKSCEPFAGKTIVFGGDFRQTLPIVRHGSQSDILNASVVSSPLWPLCQQFHFTVNMRARAGEAEFAKFLLRMGSDQLPKGKCSTFPNSIELPSSCIESGNLADSIFKKGLSEKEMANRVILTPTNRTSLALSESILEKVAGDTSVKLSADSVVSEDSGDVDLYPVDFLNSLTPTGLPPHNLKLKIGCAVMLLKNLDLEAGLTNGTRLIVRKIYNRLLEVEILTGFHSGKRHFIPRMFFQPSDSGLPFVLRRVQFPLRLAYCMTINKSQGQSFQKVGLHLDKPCFSHGQLYVAFSRAPSFDDIRVKLFPFGNIQGCVNKIWYTKNEVMHSVLKAAGISYCDSSEDVLVRTLDDDLPVLTPNRHPVSLPNINPAVFISPMRIYDPNLMSYVSPMRNISNLLPRTPESSVPIPVLTALLSPMSIDVDFNVENRNSRRGLVNFGNTCYANSILQVLFNLSDVFDRHVYLGDSVLCHTLETTIRDIGNNTSSSPLRATNFVADLARIMPEGFDVHQQQDVPEVLGALVEELVRTGYFGNDDFLTVCRVELQCLVCMASSTNRDYSKVLPLQIGSDVQSCINSFLLPEQLSEAEQWHCHQCNRPQESLKTYVFESVPRYLFVFLKRFKLQPNGQFVKSNAAVAISPSISIRTLSENTHDISNNNYNVVGCIHHTGHFQAGHYTASVVEDNQWFLCNDTVVESVSVEDLDESTVYVLLYKKV